MEFDIDSKGDLVFIDGAITTKIAVSDKLAHDIVNQLLMDGHGDVNWTAKCSSCGKSFPEGTAPGSSCDDIGGQCPPF